MTESNGCVCAPQVFSRIHRDELLVAWFWPDGDMWLQQGDCAPVQVTSDRFATQVELDWTPVEVEPGASGVWGDHSDRPRVLRVDPMTVHDCPRCDCPLGEAFAPRPATSSEWARREALRAAEEAVRKVKEARKKPAGEAPC